MKIPSINIARVSRPAGVATLALGLVVGGCETTGGMQNLGISPTVAQACTAGVVAGALTGALLSDSDNRLENALLGAAAGALIGCTAGAALSRRRQQFATNAEFYDGQIELTQQTSQEIAQINSGLRTQISANEAEIGRLQSTATLTAEDRSAAQVMLEAINTEVSTNVRRLSTLEREIEIQDQVIAEIEAAPKADADRLRDLSAEVDGMRLYVEDLRTHADTLVAQRDAIGQYT